MRTVAAMSVERFAKTSGKSSAALNVISRSRRFIISMINVLQSFPRAKGVHLILQANGAPFMA